MSISEKKTINEASKNVIVPEVLATYVTGPLRGSSTSCHWKHLSGISSGAGSI